MQNKKHVLKLIVFMMLCSLLIMPMSSMAAPNDDTTFIVGFDAEFPPYGYLDETTGEYTGFDLDLAQEVCNRNGWTLVKQPISWDSKDMELTSNSIDCVWNGFTMNGREKLYTWSEPYVDNSQVVLVRKEDAIEKLNDLEGKIVVVQADSSALAALTGEDATKENKKLAESFSDLQQVGDYNSAVMNLEAGAVDAICMDYGVANIRLKKHDTLRLLEETISTEQYGIGFKLGNKELRDKVQSTLHDMATDGTVIKIAKKYELEDSVCLEGAVEVEEKEEQTEVAVSGNAVSDAPSTTQMSFSQKLLQGVKEIGMAFGNTLLIFFLTLLFALPLGLLVAMGRMSKSKIVSTIIKVYISIMRGTPLMLQLLVVFFGPYYVFGIPVSSSYRFYAVIIGFSLNYAAYFAEIYRAGIENVPVGQKEAAFILGYTKTQTFWKITFPQMVKRVLPPVTNEIITLVKDTSLAYALAYTEMFNVARQIAASQANILPLFVAGIFYYVFNYVVAFIMERIEKKMNYFS